MDTGTILGCEHCGKANTCSGDRRRRQGSIALAPTDQDLAALPVPAPQTMCVPSASVLTKDPVSWSHKPRLSHPQLDRYRVEGMEVYSTVLWHMKRDADLSFLAQEMVAIDRMAPQVRI